jgi:hypothetical protein
MTWHQRETSDLTTRDQFQARQMVLVVTIAKFITYWYKSNDVKIFCYKSVTKFKRKPELYY